MSMLQQNNDQLVKTLMAMLKEPKVEEELNPYDPDVSPIGDFQDSPSTVRLMPVEALPNIDGDRVNRDAAASWLQRFEEIAIACGWSDREVFHRFRLHSDKPVHDWLFQIDANFLTSWTKLRAKFVKEYVKSPIPRTEIYYSMTQGQNEHIKAFFVRFNAAALRIRFDYRKSREFLEEHIDRFARNVRSRVLADAINTQQFRSIDEFEDYLDKQQQKEAIDRFQTRAKSAQPSASQAPHPVGDRSKTRKPSVQFMDMEALDDSYQAEIFALGRYNGSAKRVQCQECGREHFTIDGQCWSNLYCSFCTKMGHPETNCYKACALCIPPHNKYERCDKREKVAALKAFLEEQSIEGLPSLDPEELRILDRVGHNARNKLPLEKAENKKTPEKQKTRNP
ncbi:unnamed protein product [Aphanomyces euteiches]